MANVRSANSWFVDSTTSSSADDLTSPVVLTAVYLTATSANSVLVLSDPTTGATRINLREPTAGTTRHFRMDAAPLSFPNGIRVSTLTNAVATLVGHEPGKQ